MSSPIVLAITEEQRALLVHGERTSDTTRHPRRSSTWYKLQEKGLASRGTNYAWTLTAAGRHLRAALKLMAIKASPRRDRAGG